MNADLVEVSVIERKDVIIITLGKPNGALVMVVEPAYGKPNEYIGMAYGVGHADSVRFAGHTIPPVAFVSVMMKRDTNGALTLRYRSDQTEITMFGLPASDKAKTLFEMEVLKDTSLAT